VEGKKPKSKAKWHRIVIITTLRVLLWFFIISFCWVLLYKWVDPPFTYLMLKRKIEAIANDKPNHYNYHFVDYENISDNIKLAVIASEDQKFPDHVGFDFEAIDKAIDRNKKSKRKRGASTISQQTAKNVFLWDGRNFIRKGLEAYFTALIEMVWGKKRILEVYLNVAEMGNLTFGIDAASKKYFDKKAKSITIEEASSIAAILPNPIVFKLKSPTRFIIKRKAWIKNQMRSLGGKKYIMGLK
jgi:monofunctional glycosyltransferase